MFFCMTFPFFITGMGLPSYRYLKDTFFLQISELKISNETKRNSGISVLRSGTLESVIGAAAISEIMSVTTNSPGCS